MTSPFVDQRPQPAHPQRRDPELTLSWWMLLTIVLGLVLVCGLCFGLGYSVGHRRSQEPLASNPPVDTTQPALQISSSAPKPSANKEQPAAATTPDPADGQAGDPATTATDSETLTGAPGSRPISSGGQSPAPNDSTSTQEQTAQSRSVAPALPTNPQTASGLAPGARAQPALSPQATFLVQIAAVSHPEDASVLVNALRKRGYTVTAQRKPEDGLIHVWIGPFTSRDEANRWKLKLLDDGYNAIVQP